MDSCYESSALYLSSRDSVSDKELSERNSRIPKGIKRML